MDSSTIKSFIENIENEIIDEFIKYYSVYYQRYKIIKNDETNLVYIIPNTELNNDFNLNDINLYEYNLIEELNNKENLNHIFIFLNLYLIYKYYNYITNKNILYQNAKELELELELNNIHINLNSINKNNKILLNNFFINLIFNKILNNIDKKLDKYEKQSVHSYTILLEKTKNNELVFTILLIYFLNKLNISSKDIRNKLSNITLISNKEKYFLIKKSVENINIDYFLYDFINNIENNVINNFLIKNDIFYTYLISLYFIAYNIKISLNYAKGFKKHGLNIGYNTNKKNIDTDNLLFDIFNNNIKKWFTNNNTLTGNECSELILFKIKNPNIFNQLIYQLDNCIF